MSEQAWGSEWAQVVDVIVVGSGAAGYGAAIGATRNGARVVVLEKTSFPGGTTAKSGGVMWICNNSVMKREGIPDDRNAALRYLARTAFPTLYNPRHDTLGLPENRFRLIETFYDRGTAELEEMENEGILEIEGVAYPDYYAQLPEDETPFGRCIQPKYPAGWRRGVDPTGGALLIDLLKKGAEKYGVETRLEHQVAHLVRNSDDEVVGVEVRIGRRTELIGARKGIVFATGGFLHNKDLAREFLRGPVLGGAAAEGATGDFVNIGLEAGAKLGNMSHAWWDQVVVELAARVPQTIHDVYSPFGDSMIMVNRFGKRVVNEKSPYNERGQAHFTWDTVRGEYPNLLLFWIFDDGVLLSPENSRFRFPIPNVGESYDFVISAPTLDGLAREIGKRLEKLEHATGRVRLDDGFVPSLTSTIVRWNEMSLRGKDEDFLRGESPIEQTWAGQARDGMPNPTMHPLSESGPYHCIILGPGALDTKGGPVINEHGQVLDTSDNPIPGLYGAGNCIASPAGQAYWGPGGTVGMSLIFGSIAGKHASIQTARRPD